MPLYAHLSLNLGELRIRCFFHSLRLYYRFLVLNAYVINTRDVDFETVCTGCWIFFCGVNVTYIIQCVCVLSSLPVHLKQINELFRLRLNLNYVREPAAQFTLRLFFRLLFQEACKRNRLPVETF